MNRGQNELKLLIPKYGGFDIALRKEPQNSRAEVVCAKSLQSYLTLCDPMDGSPPGSSVHGILQARILEWVAAHSSRGSWPRDGTRVSCVSCISRCVLYPCAPWEAHRSGGRATILKIQIGLLYEYLINIVEWLIQVKKKGTHAYQCITLIHLKLFKLHIWKHEGTCVTVEWFWNFLTWHFRFSS